MQLYLFTLVKAMFHLKCNMIFNLDQKWHQLSFFPTDLI